MDFLLECIGFPPGYDLEQLAQTVQDHGEPVAWRGPRGLHLRYAFPGGIEVRLDREEGANAWTFWPYFETARRLRVVLQALVPLPDSPYDILIHGIANPPLPDDPWGETAGMDYPISAYLSDARRLPSSLPRGHVVAVSLSGFALDISYVGPDAGVKNATILDEPHGAELLPLAGDDRPGGCMEVSLRIRTIRHLKNPLTQERIDVIEADAPGRPLDLFFSRWQLEGDGHAEPRSGWRIEGAFLFTGRLAGGLPARRPR